MTETVTAAEGTVTTAWYEADGDDWSGVDGPPWYPARFTLSSLVYGGTYAKQGFPNYLRVYEGMAAPTKVFQKEVAGGSDRVDNRNRHYTGFQRWKPNTSRPVNIPFEGSYENTFNEWADALRSGNINQLDPAWPNQPYRVEETERAWAQLSGQAGDGATMELLDEFTTTQLRVDAATHVAMQKEPFVSLELTPLAYEPDVNPDSPVRGMGNFFYEPYGYFQVPQPFAVAADYLTPDETHYTYFDSVTEIVGSVGGTLHYSRYTFYPDRTVNIVVKEALSVIATETEGGVWSSGPISITAPPQSFVWLIVENPSAGGYFPVTRVSERWGQPIYQVV
jgi:hypothetical protein